jgi:type IV pilus assembly protein PilB
MQGSVLARGLKLMAGMNIAEKRVPQDGRIKMPVDATAHRLPRQTACPAYHGESWCCVSCAPTRCASAWKNLGFEQDNLEIFNKIIRGPTASSW